jgi:hypothetical protein
MKSQVDNTGKFAKPVNPHVYRNGTPVLNEDWFNFEQNNPLLPLTEDQTPNSVIDVELVDLIGVSTNTNHYHEWALKPITITKLDEGEALNTKFEKLLGELVDIAPYKIHERMKPYIMEAMLLAYNLGIKDNTQNS